MKLGLFVRIVRDGRPITADITELTEMEIYKFLDDKEREWVDHLVVDLLTKIKESKM